jgi:hypothetical protein
MTLDEARVTHCSATQAVVDNYSVAVISMLFDAAQTVAAVQSMARHSASLRRSLSILSHLLLASIAT